jgi:hypothetical protein
MYWSFPPDEVGPVKPSVTITVAAIGPDGRSLAMEHVYVGWQDNVTAVVIPAPCGIQNCHGPVISCGPIPVEICTTEYQLGDRCRALAACRVVNGSCQAVEFPGYQECSACVTECSNRTADPAKMFSCESRC